MVSRPDGCRLRGGRIFVEAVGVPGGGGVEGVEHQLEDHGVVGEVAVVDEVKGAVPLDVLVSDAGLVDERGTEGGDGGFVEGLDDRVVDACLGDGAVAEPEPVSWSAQAWQASAIRLLAPGNRSARSVRPSSVVPWVVGDRPTRS